MKKYIFFGILFACILVITYYSSISQTKIIRPNKIITIGSTITNYQNLTHTVILPKGEPLDKKIIDQKFIGTILIFKNDKILLHNGYGYSNYNTKQNNSPNTEFQIGSIQKFFTTVLILKAIEQHKLSLTTKLSCFYPQIPNAKFITISDMLNMTSGLNLTHIPNQYMNDVELIEFVKKNVKYLNQGDYKYSPVNFVLLSGILEKIYKQPYQELFINLYKNKCGLQDFGFYDNFKTKPNAAQSYEYSNKNQYNKIIPFSTNNLSHELGTGNVDMTTSDLCWFFHHLITGKLVSLNTLEKFWYSSNKSNYHGGIYIFDDYLRLNGVQAGQQAMVLLTKNMHSGVILFTNCMQSEKHAQLISYLFKKITNINAEFY